MSNSCVVERNTYHIYTKKICGGVWVIKENYMERGHDRSDQLVVH